MCTTIFISITAKISRTFYSSFNLLRSNLPLCSFNVVFVSCKLYNIKINKTAIQTIKLMKYWNYSLIYEGCFSLFGVLNIIYLEYIFQLLQNTITERNEDNRVLWSLNKASKLKNDHIETVLPPFFFWGTIFPKLLLRGNWGCLDNFWCQGEEGYILEEGFAWGNIFFSHFRFHDSVVFC